MSTIDVETDDAGVPIEVGLPPEERLARSNRDIVYACTKCLRVVGKDNLVVKRHQFKEMGVNGRIVRSRTVDWLCTIAADDGGKSCLAKDRSYNAPKLSAAPGMADTRLNPKVRAEKEAEKAAEKAAKEAAKKQPDKEET